MYEQIFGLNSRPFTQSPFVKHYFAADSIRESLAQSRMSIDRGAGPVVVTGIAGTGKSLLLAMLEDQYQSQYRIVNVTASHVNSRSDLLQAILFELDLNFRGQGESEMRLSLIDFLRPGPNCPSGILLLIDEADRLGVDELDEIRLITNLVRDGQPRARIVMAGSPKLEETLTDPSLDSLNQRIAARTQLHTLGRDETAAYIAEHINRCGGDSEKLFAEDSLRTIHELSDGLPRYINQIADHAMIIAATRGGVSIDEDIAREAWADVQSLPKPGGSSSSQPAGTPAISQDADWTVIEFGQLDDGEDVESVAPSQESEAAVASVLGSDMKFEFGEPAMASETDEPTQFQTEPDTVETVPSEAFAEEFEASFETEAPYETVNESMADQFVEEPTEIEATQDSFEQFAEPVQEIEDHVEAVNEFGNDLNSNSMPIGLSNIVNETAHSEPVEETFSHHEDFGVTASAEPVIEEAVEAPHIDATETVDDDPTVVPQSSDPFADDGFEDEELLVDTYSPFVARQNEASLNVTSKDIQQLRPIDVPTEPESASAAADEQTDAPEETFQPVAMTPDPDAGDHSDAEVADEANAGIDAGANLRMHVDTEPQDENDLNAVVEADATHAESDQMLRATAATVSMADAGTDTPVEFHNQPTAPDDEEIRRQADEIIRSLQARRTNTPEDDTPVPDLSRNAAETTAVPDILSEGLQPEIVLQSSTAPTEPTESDPGSEVAGTEQILDEIRNQQAMVDQTISASSNFNDALSSEPVNLNSQDLVPQATDQPIENPVIANPAIRPAASTEDVISIHRPTTKPELPTSNDSPESFNDPSTTDDGESESIAIPQSAYPATDDQDMLVVTRSDNFEEDDEPTASEGEFGQDQPSTGRAERIDYQTLFDQLRNIDTE